MRVFPDTNVLFAALATRGLCADLLRALLAGHEVVIGEPVLAELRRNLVTKARIPSDRADAALAFINELERAPPASKIARPPAGIDAPDAAILECAAKAGAALFVTGDRALLKLGSYAGVPIVSPRDLWLRLGQSER